MTGPLTRRSRGTAEKLHFSVLPPRLHRSGGHSPSTLCLMRLVMKLLSLIKSFYCKYQPKECPPNLLAANNAFGAGARNQCFRNAFTAVNRFTEIDKYVLGWLYFKSNNTSEKSPVEHAWVKSGNLYYDPTPIDTGTFSAFRYAPVYELSNEETKEIIYSMHSPDECELIKVGQLSFSPPAMQDVENFRNGITHHSSGIR